MKSGIFKSTEAALVIRSGKVRLKLAPILATIVVTTSASSPSIPVPSPVLPKTAVESPYNFPLPGSLQAIFDVCSPAAVGSAIVHCPLVIVPALAYDPATASVASSSKVPVSILGAMKEILLVALFVPTENACKSKSPPSWKSPFASKPRNAGSPAVKQLRHISKPSFLTLPIEAGSRFDVVDFGLDSMLLITRL